MDPVIGIDLGTTNSVVATVEDGVPTVITGRSGYKLLPSVVALSRTGKRLVGELAKRQAITNPTATISAAKRLIGRRWTDPKVAEAAARLPYKIVPGPHDDVRVQLGAEALALPEVSAMVLTELRLDAETHLNGAVTKAVITVPAYFSDSQRQATRDAGRIAGLDVLRIINEPTAAALAYGFGRQVDKRVAVFDLGGGTFDISLLEISNGVFDVIATGGDTSLGGEDFDQRLVDWLADQFMTEHQVDLRKDPMALQRLRDAAEKAKCELSGASRAEVNLPFIIGSARGPLHLQRVVTREKLEELTADLVQRCTAICDAVLKEAELVPQKLEEVILVGGMTRMPRVQEACRQFFGRDPSRNVHPEEVVALGAAIQARALTRDSSEMLLLDVTPRSLGISIAGGLFDVLVPRNTTVPTSARHLFTTVKDNQTTARIMVMQGESPKADENELLGEFILSGLKQAPRGQVEIEVIFDISADGIVSVSARDTETGQRQSITVTATSGLTEDEVSHMMEQNADYMVQAKGGDQFDALRTETGRIAKEIEALLPRMRTGPLAAKARGAAAGAEMALDQLREALAGRDVHALQLARDTLDRSLQVLRGLAQR